jgi:glucosamine 6-phosphate synthetase-like amidotransferase/phosphosugar isomerase protein
MASSVPPRKPTMNACERFMLGFARIENIADAQKQYNLTRLKTLMKKTNADYDLVYTFEEFLQSTLATGATPGTTQDVHAASIATTLAKAIVAVYAFERLRKEPVPVMVLQNAIQKATADIEKAVLLGVKPKGSAYGWLKATARGIATKAVTHAINAHCDEVQAAADREIDAIRQRTAADIANLHTIRDRR